MGWLGAAGAVVVVIVYAAMIGSGPSTTPRPSQRPVVVASAPPPAVIRPTVIPPSVFASQHPWNHAGERSPIDDTQRVYLSTTSLIPHVNQYGETKDLVLWVACRENKTSLWINFAGEFMADGGQDYSPVTYRVDAKPARTLAFHESNDNAALGLWSGGSAIPFIKELFGGDRLFVRATPFSENAVETTFRIAGLAEEITSLRRVCHW